MKTLINLSAFYNAQIEFNEQSKRHFVKVRTNKGLFYVIENGDSYLVTNAKDDSYVRVKDSFDLVTKLIVVFGGRDKEPEKEHKPQLFHLEQ